MPWIRGQDSRWRRKQDEIREWRARKRPQVGFQPGPATRGIDLIWLVKKKKYFECVSTKTKNTTSKTDVCVWCMFVRAALSFPYAVLSDDPNQVLSFLWLFTPTVTVCLPNCSHFNSLSFQFNSVIHCRSWAALKVKYFCRILPMHRDEQEICEKQSPVRCEWL